ncbi:MAG: hypothetical protein ACJ72W_18765 [Actinoallomurus sp.]
MVLTVMTTAALTSATGAAAESASRLRADSICQSAAGINAYANQYGFTPRYVAQMCNQNADTHWNVMEFRG